MELGQSKRLTLICTAGDNSFGFVNFVGAETQFAGSALNCTSGDKGFAAAGTTGGTSKIIRRSNN